jgi:hypothetical protein
LAVILSISSISALNAQDAPQSEEEKQIFLDAPLLKAVNVAQAAFRKDQPSADDSQLDVVIVDRDKHWTIGIVVKTEGIQEKKLDDGRTIVTMPSMYNHHGEHSMTYEIDKTTFKILRSYLPR